MSKSWEKKVLNRPGAAERIEELEHKMLVAQGLAAARKACQSLVVIDQPTGPRTGRWRISTEYEVIVTPQDDGGFTATVPKPQAS